MRSTVLCQYMNVDANIYLRSFTKYYTYFLPKTFSYSYEVIYSSSLKYPSVTLSKFILHITFNACWVTCILLHTLKFCVPHTSRNYPKFTGITNNTKTLKNIKGNHRQSTEFFWTKCMAKQRRLTKNNKRRLTSVKNIFLHRTARYTLPLSSVAAVQPSWADVSAHCLLVRVQCLLV